MLLALTKVIYIYNTVGWLKAEFLNYVQQNIKYTTKYI